MFGSQHYNQVLQVAITTAYVPLLLHISFDQFLSWWFHFWHQSDGTSWSIVPCRASSMPTTKVSSTISSREKTSFDSPISARTSACHPAYLLCSWLSTRTPGSLEQLTTGSLGLFSVLGCWFLIDPSHHSSVSKTHTSGSLAAGLVHNIWLWCRPGLPSELTEDLIDSEDEEERTPPNPFDWKGEFLTVSQSLWAVFCSLHGYNVWRYLFVCPTNTFWLILMCCMKKCVKDYRSRHLCRQESWSASKYSLKTDNTFSQVAKTQVGSGPALLTFWLKDLESKRHMQVVEI